MILVAQTEIVSWASVAATVVNAGFADFVAWYLLTKALPKQQDEFRKTLKDVQTDYMASLKAIQDKHDLRIEGHRAESRDALDALMKQWDREASRRDEHFRIEVNLLQKQMQDHGEILEDVRDWLTKRPKRAGPRLPPRDAGQQQ